MPGALATLKQSKKVEGRFVAPEVRAALGVASKLVSTLLPSAFPLSRLRVQLSARSRDVSMNYTFMRVRVLCMHARREVRIHAMFPRCVYARYVHVTANARAVCECYMQEPNH